MPVFKSELFKILPFYNFIVKRFNRVVHIVSLKLIEGVLLTWRDSSEMIIKTPPPPPPLCVVQVLCEVESAQSVVFPKVALTNNQ